MQNLSKSDEQKLLDGVKKAVDLVDNGGLSPNEAMKKVAEEMQYSPGFLKAACNAFNNGRQLAQWNANDSILDKLASFPLADYEEVHKNMWGDTKEKSASFSYVKPPIASYDAEFKKQLLSMPLSSLEKAASDDLHPMAADELADRASKKAYSSFEFARRVNEEARRVKSAANAELEVRINTLSNYFKKFAHDRLPFAEVENAVAVYYGEAGKALMSHIAADFPREKRASDYKPNWSGFAKPADRNQEPYILVAACIKQAEVLHRATENLEAADRELRTAKECVASFSQPRFATQNGSQSILTPSLIEDGSGQKSASLLGGLAFGAGGGVAKSIADAASQNSAKQLEEQVRELESPEHLNELRKIRAQTVLTQLLSDPESPLSKYDPEEVLTTYNDLVQFSPRLADQPSAIAPLLNKRLMGNTEPFEIGEQLKLEQGLKSVQDQKSPTDLMQNEASILS